MLVGTILQYLDIGTLRSTVTIDGASRISTELMFGARTICCELRSMGAVLNDSSWAIGPLESILNSASPPLWWLRISRTGEIFLISEISDCRRLICSAISLIVILWFEFDSESLFNRSASCWVLHQLILPRLRKFDMRRCP